MKEAVGKKLKKLRGHLTQDAMASGLGVPKPTYVKWEHGSVYPPPEKLCEIADKYKVTIDNLYGRETESKPLGGELTEDEKEYIATMRSLRPEERIVVVNLLLKYKCSVVK
ncbi:helix-turn-helix transcriptional regulator [Deltaproteobacteria bacterium IMCC39524]|nr:helix-turn-helix transcriptional regulator [Deltaproteobacteria bacterium IMCC39524]